MLTPKAGKNGISNGNLKVFCKDFVYLRDGMVKNTSTEVQLMGGLREHKRTKQEGEGMEIKERMDLDSNNNVKHNGRVSLLDDGETDVCFSSSSAVILLIFPQSFSKG